MPGPLSAPNKDRRVTNPRVREAARKDGTLRTGKTAAKRAKLDRPKD